MAKFRNDWKNEVNKKSESTEEKSSANSKNIAVYHEFTSRKKKQIEDEAAEEPTEPFYYEQPMNNEDKALYLFNKGVSLEQQSRHYEGFYFLISQVWPQRLYFIKSLIPSFKKLFCVLNINFKLKLN